ncbi:glycosyltransferase family 20 protein [Xylariaceae sp. FL1019]|nr:glycosyltransferase family 20 protein [Xylariaceae sp. FL1019]
MAEERSHRAFDSPADDTTRSSKHSPQGQRYEDDSDPSSTDLPPHLRPSITRVPVTPGFLFGSQNFDAPPETTDRNHGYFNQYPYRHGDAARTTRDFRRHEEASGVKQGLPTIVDSIPEAMSDEEMLRRMSASTNGRVESISDIKSSAPELDLTGNIISVTFTTPNTFKYHKNGEWELGSRHGQSALLDAFAYLSSEESPWGHSVVAWTGEIECPIESISTPSTPPNRTAIAGLNQLSAPVPLRTDVHLPPTPPDVDGLWVSRDDQRKLEQQLAQRGRAQTIPVWLADDHEVNGDGITLNDQSRWRRYAEHELYPLFHYKQHEPTDGRSERVEWANYYRANLQFANKVIEVYKPGDIVIIHDYYLLLLPTMLRQRMPDMYISFFLHCPFPSSEFLRCLPRRKEVLEGLLGSNLVGFQSYGYSRHFTSCCTRILDIPSDTTGLDAFGTRVEVGVYPIGIDAKKVEKLAWSEDVSGKYEALREIYHGKRIIVGRDRLDSVRGVAQKLMAFERFLEMYPEWRNQVVLIQVTSPTSIQEERGESENKIASRVNELVMKINGTFGSLGFSPVQHYPQYLAPDEYFALLRAAEIGLITSVRDGMNTTSLEYVVCQRDTHGPLILSEFSGTAGSLRDAIHINPWDLSDVAKQINNALTMSAEKREAMQLNLYNHVTTQTVKGWITKFLRKLLGTLASNQNEKATPLLDRIAMLQQYRAADKRLFLFDYDGTLTPIVRDPQAAVPSDRVITALKTLAGDHRNAVWVISGRDQDFLQQHLGHISELGFSAEHGSFIRHPGATTWENLAETFDMSWQTEVMDVFQKYTDRVPGAFIERKRCALTWHYRQADPDQGLHASRLAYDELNSTATKKWDVEVMKGKANLEVRPTFINKGEIVKRLVREYNSGVEFVFCCGDDFTDEDMFRALNDLTDAELESDHVFTVSVGASKKATLAKWHVLEPADIIGSTALIAGVGTDGTNENLSPVNLATVASLEGRLPTRTS